MERERERERERMMIRRIYVLGEGKYTITARRLKTGLEPIWFELMPCASFYIVFRNTSEVSRMFQRNLEYTSIS